MSPLGVAEAETQGGKAAPGSHSCLWCPWSLTPFWVQQGLPGGEPASLSCGTGRRTGLD